MKRRDINWDDVTKLLEEYTMKCIRRGRELIEKEKKK